MNDWRQVVLVLSALLLGTSQISAHAVSTPLPAGKTRFSFVDKKAIQPPPGAINQALCNRCCAGCGDVLNQPNHKAGQT